ncbi:hypothetical protein CW705_02780 [Candidatus Bathyarchaeota archaeon]|nr:MAG: hypothetical protein CW705_02780 [Candidatus Bathyarchaeota archaeon]
MKFLGQVYKLKETLTEIKSELTPSFDEVLRRYQGQFVRTKFKDPTYTIEATYPTEPLKTFIRRIIGGLQTPTVQGTYLIRGFGFGKTHALILLWHLLNSKEAAKSKLARDLGIDEELTRETITIGADFSKEKPLSMIFGELEALAKRRPEWTIKDPKLSQAAIEVIGRITRREALALSTEKMANIVTTIAEKYRNLGGNPRILLLIDEFGIGIIKRIINYIETGNEEKYTEIERMINFIENLYVRLSGQGIPTYIIVALAEQDERELNAIQLQQADKPEYYNKIEGLRKRLDAIKDRLGRAAGGLTEEAALSQDPQHAIEIAKHRVLKQVDDKEAAANSLISYLYLQAEQYNLTKALESQKEIIKVNYPFSPSMIWLLKKIMNPIDAPRTEYVRTVIYIAAEAAERALTLEPERTFTIGVEHLPLARAGVIDLMGEFETEWTGTITDMEHAIRTAPSEIKRLATSIAGQILAKGTTANVTALIEVRDINELKRYGVSPEEIQIDLLATREPEEASKTLTRIEEAVEYLKTKSARIEEKEYDGQKFYLPSLMRTIFDKLAAFVSEQQRILEDEAQIPAYLQSTGIPSLFYNPKAFIPSREREVTILLKEYNTVLNIDELLDSEDVRESQRAGKATLIVVPPWDAYLFNELYKRRTDYHTLINTISQKLRGANAEGKIARPFHLSILIPNISPEKLTRLKDDVISYMAVKEFLKHLKDKERIIEDRLYDYEKTIQKRLTLRLVEYFEQQRKKLETSLRHSLERQILDASSSAQRELIKLTRRIAASVLELYDEAIYCSLQTRDFTSKNLIQLFSELEPRIEREKAESIQDYSLIINMFFGKVIGLIGLTWNLNAIADALYKHYENEIMSGAIREQDRISEVIENLMLGTYEIKPLSAKIAREAIQRLNGRTVKTEDIIVTLKVDESRNLIKFEYEKIKPPPPTKEAKPPPTITLPPITPPERIPIKTIKNITLDINQSFNYDEFRAKLETLYNTYGTLINSINIGASGNTIRVEFSLIGAQHTPSTVVGVIRFLSHLLRIYKTTPYIDIKFSSPIPQEKVAEIFGEEVLKKVRRSWDRLLPT